MHNPLENFLLNLAEKIQTEKEYKEIVKNSESVDVNKDVFAGFIEGIANTIKENVKKEVPEETPSQPDPLDNFLATLGEKLKNLPEKKNEQEQEQVKENEPIKQEEPVEEPKPAETKPENEPIQPEKTEETPDAFAGFVNNLANILKKTPEQKTEQPVENEKPKEPVNDYVKVLSNNKKVKTPEIKNIEKKPEENEETPDIKKFVANFVTKELESFKNDLTEKYLKKAAVLSEYAGGGGTNAVQYANGGTMNGDLNVNGQILSGGIDLANIFGSGSNVNLGDIPVLSGNWNSTYSTVYSNSASWGTGGNAQTLSFNENNAQLSLSFGNTVSLSALSGASSTGDSAVNSLVHNNSAYWNAAYTNLVSNSAAYLLSGTEVNLGDIPTLSGYWNEAYTNLVTNSAAYLLSGTEVNLGDIPSLSSTWTNAYTNLIYNSAAYLSGVDISLITTTSASWNSVYSNVNSNSSYYALTNASVTFTNNVTINGNLTALGTSTFQNTIFTTTSALSVINNGPGPALYVSQSPGNFDVASFYDQDGIEVLHVGNAPIPGTLAKVGINESYPSTELTVRGAISASSSITVLNGNSNQWNSVYSSFNTNSAKYDSNYTTTNNNSASWSSVYTSFSNQSANNASVYTTVNNNSSTTWNYQGTDIKNLTAGWVGGNSAYTSLNSNSGKYESNWSVTNTNSAFWSQAYTNLVTNSATYLGTTRQFDYVQVGLNSYSYCGFAVPGTSTASTGWTIKRLFFSTAGTLLSSGTVTNSIWNSRYSYNY